MTREQRTFDDPTVWDRAQNLLNEVSNVTEPDEPSQGAVHPASAPNDTPDRADRGLHRTVASTDEPTADALGELETPQLRAALSGVDESVFSPAVRAAADLLLRRGEAPTLAVRANLVAAAERGVRARRLNRAPRLPVVLRQGRLDLAMSMDAVAAATGIASSQLIRVEQGAAPLTALSPTDLGRWIQTVRVSAVEAVEALQRSLLPAAQERSSDARKYIRAVAQYLEVDPQLAQEQEESTSEEQDQGPHA